MRKSLVLAVALLIIALASSGANAATRPTGPEIEAREQAALELEQLFFQLIGALPESPTIHKHGKGLYSISAPVGDFTAAATAASQFRILDVGQQASIPQNPSYLSSAVQVSARTIPNYWWAVWNATGDDRVAATKVTVRGGGQEHLSLNESLTYRAGEITIHWQGVNRQIGHPGIHTIKAKVAGAGKGKASYLVE